MVVTDLQEEKVAEVAAGIGEQALGLRLDVTSREDVDAAVAAAVDRFGRLDVVVNNAGGCIVTSVPEDTDRRGVAPAARPHPGRRVPVHPGSAAPLGEDPRQRGHDQLGQRPRRLRQHRVLRGQGRPDRDDGQNYAARYGELGVRFNVVAPGTIRTPNWDGQPEALERLSKMYPLGRVGEPEDIAAAVAFLASDDAAWITGHTLPVEGGVLTGPRGEMDLTPSGFFRKDYPGL